MANFNQQGMQQIPIQYPYNTTNNLISNFPYENYIGRNLTYQNQYLKCRPVASKEQAKAAQIDLDGSLWVFTDVGNQKIYTKQINNDGTATFKIYTLTADENPYTSSEYITKDEFNKVIQNLMAVIQVNKNTQSAKSNNENKTPIANF